MDGIVVSLIIRPKSVSFQTCSYKSRSYAAATLAAMYLASEANWIVLPKDILMPVYVCMYVSVGQGSSLLLTHMLRPL